MLNIRQEQIEAMLMHNEEKFIDFVVKHVQQECPDDIRGIDPVSLREMVINGLARARSYDLEKPQYLTAFVAIMFDISPNFDEQADIQRALRDKSVPIEQRFNAMIEGVPDKAWEEAEKNQNYDAAMSKEPPAKRASKHNDAAENSVAQSQSTSCQADEEPVKSNCDKANEQAEQADDLLTEKMKEKSYVVAGSIFVPTEGTSKSMMSSSRVSTSMITRGKKYNGFSKAIKKGNPSNVPCSSSSTELHEYTKRAFPYEGHAEAKIIEDIFAQEEPRKGTLYLKVKNLPVCDHCDKLIKCAKESIDIIICD
jgi:hypothetical protein